MEGADLELIAKFNVRQFLAVPLLGTRGEVLGLLGLLDRINGENISTEDVRRASALATHVAVALEVTRNLHLSEQHRARAESLMGLALELSSMIRAPEFGKTFVTHAAQMTGASAGALLVEKESGLETVVLQSLAGDDLQDPSLLREFNAAILRALTNHPESIVSSNAQEVLGPVTAETLGWRECTFVRLFGTTGELVGVLCLAKSSAIEDQQVLQAIAGQASVAFENARFFSRMDRANRHWIEIFDSITDFIVSHDEAGNVLRVNRSLAEFIGVPPQELIGVNMSALLATGSETPSRSCPFCRSTGEGAGEYVHPVLERIFLVSTSLVHGASSEVLQTIHVLKDITDRREAERRYRELFDNIQEGLFFSTPDGRFVEVNDALVRMLGYGTREELLQADVRNQVYFSPQHLTELTELIERQGLLRNHEQTLRRKDGTPVHVLTNAFAVRDAQDRMLQYRGLMLDISGRKNVSIGTAKRARFFRQNSQQHAKPHPGHRHQRSGQLCQPSLV